VRQRDVVVPDDVGRATVTKELADRGLPRLAVEAWCMAWQAAARRMGLEDAGPDYWTIGLAWIDERLREGQTPPTR
jgi:hypothetical protein